MILEIPTETDGTPHYSFRIELEGRYYTFTFRFGTRRGGWVFDLHTIEGEAIIVGRLVTIGRDFLDGCVSNNRPPGSLWAWNIATDNDTEGARLELPGIFDLGAGGRCRMYYTESTTDEENALLGITSLDDL